MVERIIDWCARNRFLVFSATIVLTVWGVWAMRHTPLDAVPDISDVQVIVSTEWMGRSPDLIEDQVTYPIVTALLSTPRVQHGARLHRLRHLVRLRHLRGRHRHLLGAQPRRRVPAGHPRPAARGGEPRDRPRRDRRRLGVPVRARRRHRAAHARRSAQLPGLVPPLLAAPACRASPRSRASAAS